jgi:lipoic acid synthetase
MKRRGFYTKSSIMAGVGELKEEVIEAMYDLRSVGVDFLTIGQYLRPSEKHLEIHEYITPEQFEDYKKLGDEMGFASIASGPLVRSSYKAGELFIKRHITRENQTGARL